MTEERRRISFALPQLVLVEIAIVAVDGFDLLTLGLGIFIGIQAGLAATKAVEVYTAGPDHVIVAQGQMPQAPKA